MPAKRPRRPQPLARAGSSPLIQWRTSQTCTACSTIQSPERSRRPSQPPWPVIGPLLLLQAARASTSGPSSPLPDPLDRLAIPRVRPPLEADVHRQAGRLRGQRGQPIAGGQGRGQRLLGVEVLPRRDRIAIDRLVQVARQRDDDRVDVRPIQQPPRVVVRLRPMALGLLDDPLPAEPVLGLGVADRDDRRPLQLQQAPQQRRARDCRCRSLPAAPGPTRPPRRAASARLPCDSARLAAAEQPRNRRRFTRIGGIGHRLHECSAKAGVQTESIARAGSTVSILIGLRGKLRVVGMAANNRRWYTTILALAYR